MLVVDVEATGVNVHKHAIVSVGGVDLENPKNMFYEECRIFAGAHIDDEALAVNGFSREQVQDTNKQTDEELIQKFLTWIEPAKDRTIAGQNPSFDRDFLQASAERYGHNWPLAYRTVDLHSVCVAHFFSRGKNIPLVKNRSGLDLDAIARYCGLGNEPTPHNGLTGAKYEAECFSRLLRNTKLLDEFQNDEIPWQ